MEVVIIYIRYNIKIKLLFFLKIKQMVNFINDIILII